MYRKSLINFVRKSKFSNASKLNLSAKAKNYIPLYLTSVWGWNERRMSALPTICIALWCTANDAKKLHLRRQHEKITMSRIFSFRKKCVKYWIKCSVIKSFNYAAKQVLFTDFEPEKSCGNLCNREKILLGIN